MRLALHIFRKDARCLWYECAVVLLLTVLFTWNNAQPPRSMMGTFDALINVLAPIAWFLLVFRLMQADPFPSSDHDWLTRPIPRTTLFSAKALFIVTFLFLPEALACCAIAAAQGFNAFAYPGAFAWHLLGFLAIVVLPAAAIGVITSSITAASSAALLLTVACWLTLSMTLIRWQGIVWFPLLLMLAGFTGLCSLVLAIQFRWPLTTLARGVAFLAVPLLGVIVALLPLNVGFAAQHLFIREQALPTLCIEMLRHSNSDLLFRVVGVPQPLQGRIQRFDGFVRTPRGKSPLHRSGTSSHSMNSIDADGVRHTTMESYYSYVTEPQSVFAGEPLIDVDGTVWVVLYEPLERPEVHALSAATIKSPLMGSCSIDRLGMSERWNFRCSSPFRNSADVCWTLRDRRDPGFLQQSGCMHGYDYSPVHAPFPLSVAASTYFSFSNVDARRLEDFTITVQALAARCLC